MSQTLPSLDVISNLVLAEREAQLRHVEALDTKAGIVLGFAGAIVALGTRATSPLTIAGTAAAALAAALAMWTFVPRRFPVLEARSLRLHSLPPISCEERFVMDDTPKPPSADEPTPEPADATPPPPPFRPDPELIGYMEREQKGAPERG